MRVQRGQTWSCKLRNRVEGIEGQKFYEMVLIRLKETLGNRPGAPQEILIF